MSSRPHSPSSRSRTLPAGLLRLLGGLAFGASAGLPVAAAQEGATRTGEAAAVERSRQPDTIDSARDEIRRLKAERDAPLPASGGLPRVAAPEWHGGPAPLKPVPPPKKTPGTEARRNNWLVDALQRPAPAAGTGVWREREEIAAEQDSMFLPDVRSDQTSAARTGKPTAEQGSRERPERESAGAISPAVANPLTRFLDDWMTPQDYALLGGPRAGNPSALLLPGGSLAAPSADATAVAPMPLTPRIAEALPGMPSLPARAAPRENPFLAALNAPLPMLAPVPTPPPAIVSSLPNAVAPAVAPPPAPPQRVPDFARPSTDEKYFKPLRRF